MFIESVLKK